MTPPRTATPVAVALGSNLGDRLANLRFGLGRLRACLEELRASPVYETAPLHNRDQPEFLNACVVGRTRLAARQLLSQLQDAERAAGRRAARRRWGPRPLDLDLLLYGSEPMRMPGLVVPHPRMRDRGFVLIPLAAIAPEWIVAAHGEERPATVQELAALVDRSGVRVTNLSLEG